MVAIAADVAAGSSPSVRPRLLQVLCQQKGRRWIRGLQVFLKSLHPSCAPL